MAEKRPETYPYNRLVNEIIDYSLLVFLSAVAWQCILWSWAGRVELVIAVTLAIFVVAVVVKFSLSEYSDSRANSETAKKLNRLVEELWVTKKEYNDLKFYSMNLLTENNKLKAEVEKCYADKVNPNKTDNG